MPSPVSATRLTADKQAMLVNGAIAGDPAWAKRVRFIRAWRVVALLGLVLLLAHPGLGASRAWARHVFNSWVYNALELAAVAGCLMRVVYVRSDRVAWGLLTAACSWTVADLLFTFAYANDPPFPSLADVFYLAFYPLCYVGLLLLVRAHIADFNRSLWLDGLMAAMGSAAPRRGGARRGRAPGHGRPPWTDHEHRVSDRRRPAPALVIGVFALSGWRPGRTWLSRRARVRVLGDRRRGISLPVRPGDIHARNDPRRPLARRAAPDRLVCLAGSPIRSAKAREAEPWLATPAVAGLIAIGVLVYDHYHRLNSFALALAVATLVVILVRTRMTFRENGRMLERIHRQAITDSLTRLGNRRSLVTDLDRGARRTGDGTERLLVIFDLNGFKRYNDTLRPSVRRPAPAPAERSTPGGGRAVMAPHIGSAATSSACWRSCPKEAPERCSTQRPRRCRSRARASP